jgi:hypothetical protein
MPALSSQHLPTWLMQLFATGFLAVLFLQSGLDKVFDWRGNHKYIGDFFGKTPLASAAPLMLGVLTVMEVVTGSLCALGVLQLLVMGSAKLAFWGAALATATFVSLFLGQRIAKDYAAAAGMAPYFLVGLTAMFLTSH